MIACLKIENILKNFCSFSQFFVKSKATLTVTIKRKKIDLEAYNKA